MNRIDDASITQTLIAGAVAATALLPLASFPAPARATPAHTTPAIPAKHRSTPDPVQSVQDGPGKVPAQAPTANHGDDVTNLDAVSVSALRPSLQTAQSIKRDAEAIVDVVVAQDIGKLPDNTAMESIARVVGVQVTRYNDEANGLLVRGLPDVTTAYNGREIFNSNSRNDTLQDFPSQAIEAIEVYKSGKADLFEGGLSGLINIRSRRPFDFKGRVVAGGVRWTYNDQSMKYDPNGNLLYSNRWKNSLGEWGFLGNVTFSQYHYYNGVRFNATNFPEVSPDSPVSPGSVGQRFHYPDTVGLYNESGKRWRPSANFSVQFRPNDESEYYLEGFWQGYRGRGMVDDFSSDLRLNDPTLTDVVLIPGTQQVRSLVKSGGSKHPQTIYRSTNSDETNTYQLAIGAIWYAGDRTWSTDLAYTTSEYKNQAWSLDSALANPQTVAVDFMKNDGVAFSLPGFDPGNPDNYLWRGFYESINHPQGSGWQWRGDLEWVTDIPIFSTFQFGSRVTTRKVESEYGSRYASTLDLGIPLASLPVGPLVLTSDPFRGNAQPFTRYLQPTRDGIAGQYAALQQASIQALQQLLALHPKDQGYRDALTAFQAGHGVPLDPNSAFHATEDTYTVYAQTKYAFDIGPAAVDGLIGARAVQTIGDYSGTSRTSDTKGINLVSSTTHQNYWDILPNASMRIHFTPELQLRLGYTYTRSRPGFGQLNPALNISQVIRDPDKPANPNDPAASIDATGSGGNPNLKPLTSYNYDASLEYYFSRHGYASLAIFQHDVDGFISNYTRYIKDPTYGLIQLSRPENAGKGRIKGVEANFETFLTWLPGRWSNFGIQTNFTYLDAKNAIPVFDSTTADFTYGKPVAITGVSRHAYNAALFYEDDHITTRLSWNNRSKWINWYGTDVAGGATYNSTRARGRLDFSFSYALNKQLRLTLDVSNILAHPFTNYTGYTGQNLEYTQDVRDEGRYFGVGLNFKFGE